MIAPVGSWVSSFRVSAERFTVSRQRPVYVDVLIQLRQKSAVSWKQVARCRPSVPAGTSWSSVEDLEAEQGLGRRPARARPRR